MTGPVEAGASGRQLERSDAVQRVVERARVTGRDRRDTPPETRVV